MLLCKTFKSEMEIEHAACPSLGRISQHGKAHRIPFLTREARFEGNSKR